MTPTGQWPIVILYKKQTHVTSISLNCMFISQRNSNPNLKTASTLGVQLPSGPQVSVLVRKQESAVEREFIMFVLSACAQGENWLYLWSSCISFPILQSASLYQSILKQVSRFIPRPLRHIFKVKTSVHRSLFSNCMAFLDSGYISGYRDKWHRKMHR